MGFFSKVGMSHKGLRYKLILAFALMSIIPLMACVYVISLYVFPQMENLINVSAVILISLVIAMLGLLLAKGLITPVIDMALEARVIADGHYDKTLAIASDDEVGNLAQSINSMTQKIRTNLDELKGYGQRMREINVDIHKKVLGLSNLLQIGDVISSGTLQLDSVLELAVEKVAMVFDTGFAALYLPRGEGQDMVARFMSNISEERLAGIVVRKGQKGLLERSLEERTMLIIDKTVKESKGLESFKQDYGLKNILAIPIYSGSRDLGLLVVGTRLDNFKFKDEDIDLIKVFAKQMSIAIENDVLVKKTQELAIKDDLTDLYNKTYILARLEEEIRRAIFYQRPCSFLIFNIDNFKKFRDIQGELAAEEVLKKLAKVLTDNSTPVGKVARIGGDEFAMLLPEKNKKEASYIGEDVRKKIESSKLVKDKEYLITVSVGVSENPIDGVTGDELLKKALEAVKSAKSFGKNKLVA